MKDSTYFFCAGLLDAWAWGGELIGKENLPDEGPAVFVANHLGPLGPIGAISSIPLRLYFWIIGDMVNKELAPEYLRLDFIEPRLKLTPPFSQGFSKFLSKITVPLLRSLDCVPIYRGNIEKCYDTLNESLALLLHEKCLLVFPENSEVGADTLTHMRSFQKTVFRLGELYYGKTRKRLEFYPVAIHPTRKVQVGEPYSYHPIASPAQERLRMKELVEASVRRMYLEMEGGDFNGLLTPER